jgi:hypothetical protein
MVYQNYKNVVEDLVQVISSQEKELAEKSTLVADLQKQLENSGNFLLHFISLASFCTVALADQYCLYFRHPDAAKLKSTLEGVERGHAIAMEGLQMQLQKSLTANTLLEEQLNDQERQNRQKQKEVEDLCKAAADFEKQQNGFNEVLNNFQKTLLGNDGSPYCVVCNNMLCRV